MLASLISANIGLLTLGWAITLFFLCLSALLCLAIVIRRILRNRAAARRDKEKTNFLNYLILALKQDGEEQDKLMAPPPCETSEMAHVFLHYFRTLKGEKLEYLQQMISGSALEERLIQNTSSGIRGVRMRCLRTLSYLDSQKSLQIMFDKLSSDDKYIRLTAARCLVRRKSLCYLNAIIESLSEAFPKDFKILAGVLAGFGNESIEFLETYISQTDDDVVKTACLEALVVIMPPQTSLDFTRLMTDKSDSVRAAALSLSAIAKHNQMVDPLRLGLKDEAISVKIRAAKMACTVKRTDITTELYKLTSDPVMWVRYWAIRAIWVSGQSGQTFVNTLSKSDIMAKNVALEMRSGYV